MTLYLLDKRKESELLKSGHLLLLLNFKLVFKGTYAM
jgi:hypothetical protein